MEYIKKSLNQIMKSKLVNFSIFERNEYKKLNEEEDNALEDFDESEEAARSKDEQVGDGQDPNIFWVTVSNAYKEVDESNKLTYPVKQFKSKVISSYNSYPDAKEAIGRIILDGQKGPRSIVIEDRKKGIVYEKFLEKRKSVTWDEHEDGSNSNP